MRKEIIGILIFFLVVFSLVSLLSYSPTDPSIHSAGTSGEVHNLFGVIGAQLAGLLVGFFGVGAFWVPVLLLLVSIQLLSNHTARNILTTLAGGLMLVVITGSLLSLRGNHVVLFGSKFSTGGITGIPLKTFLVDYANQGGAWIILILLWLIGLILATRFSLLRFFSVCLTTMRALIERIRTQRIKRQERRAKAQKRVRPESEASRRRARKVKIEPRPAQSAPKIPAPQQQVFDFMRDEAGYQLPLVSFLKNPDPPSKGADDENLRKQSQRLEKKLADFGVDGRVVTVVPGPVVTTYEYQPAPGVKINKIVNLTDDLALALRAMTIRIVAPIPGKAAIGIEIPNAERELVRFKDVVASEAFQNSRASLTLCLGKDIVGQPVITALEKMPHLLIAGATGTGKSVGLNAMICSILYQSTPAQVKLILIDPKRIELSPYDGIPHLITPVVTDVLKATNALYWAVNEMERRYSLLSEQKSRNIHQYNQKIERLKKSDPDQTGELLPYIVIIIDELADLMMVASRDVEVALTRLAQMARAAGIHLILATQRPSVDVLTGIIKANFPTRLSFQVSSRTDSRTIIDGNGAENLLGNGDMLFLPPGVAKLQRVHGAYISEAEIARICGFLKEQGRPDYEKGITDSDQRKEPLQSDEEVDERYDDAVALVTQTRQASISKIQRHLRIGYNRAARIVEMMEKEGIVGPADGAKPREVLVRSLDDLP